MELYCDVVCDISCYTDVYTQGVCRNELGVTLNRHSYVDPTMDSRENINADSAALQSSKHHVQVVKVETPYLQRLILIQAHYV